MVGRCIRYYNSPFFGDMLVFRGVCFRPPRLLANSYSEKAIYEKKLLARLHGAGIDVFGQLRMDKPSKKIATHP